VLLFHFLLSAHPTISAKDGGEQNAKKPDLGGGSTFSGYRKKGMKR